MRSMRVVLVSVALLSGGLLHAQEGVKFGLRLSPGIGFFGVDSSGRTSIKNLTSSGAFNIAGGLMLSFGFSDNVALILGLGMARGSGKITLKPDYGIVGRVGTNADTLYLRETGLTGESPISYRLTSLNVPVFIKLRTNPIAETPIRAKALLGGQVDLRIGSSTKSERRLVAESFIDEGVVRTSDHFGSFFAQLSAGAGVDVVLEGIGTIDFTILYNHGLTNFLNKDFKFEATVNNTTYTDLKPYEKLRGILSTLQFQLIFWFGE
ncbi:MAG: outer membrane beta-barrel protein [Bacteroidia bacterium]|nr:outer membrane beta-barrel protein [Bacteroidia bacterium]MDW8088637.1 outer membrane beta-barrel protein [Bacteroidia bacterium]